MAERNVPDAITTGVMGNAQGNRQGIGDTDMRSQQGAREGYRGVDRRRVTSEEWRGVERRQARARIAEEPPTDL